MSSHEDPNTGQERQDETFTPAQVLDAVEGFLEMGESAFHGFGHAGYYSGNGWAARCLRWHRDQLRGKAEPRRDDDPVHESRLVCRDQFGKLECELPVGHSGSHSSNEDSRGRQTWSYTDDPHDAVRDDFAPDGLAVRP